MSPGCRPAGSRTVRPHDRGRKARCSRWTPRPAKALPSRGLRERGWARSATLLPLAGKARPTAPCSATLLPLRSASTEPWSRPGHATCLAVAGRLSCPPRASSPPFDHSATIAAVQCTGLLITYVALNLMDGHGQPALLYIVPFTLGTFLSLGWKRAELRNLWTKGEPDRVCPHVQSPAQ
ncbi:Signal peptide peptidase-like 5 [Platanthera guangdongensis]|uniref:Signal peptide peptidase-like 5 n=1 Tax=Platanthera guangdongensis TaxID=2320717 RepID=A0ABR2MZH4_9ASPA